MKPSGELIKIDANSEVQSALKNAKLTDLSGNSVKSVFPQPVITGIGVVDTLSYFDGDPDSYTSRFGFTGQDVMMTWFVAPADMDIKAIGFKAAADDVLGDQVSIRLVKLNWTEEQIKINAATHVGYYPSAGDGFGNQSAFPEDATGDWVDLSDGEYPTSPFSGEDFDLWSDFGFGYPVTPIGVASEDPAYQWIETSQLFEPSVLQGEIFAIAVIHDGTTLDEERIGFWTMDGPTTGIFSWKFYENGRNVTGGAGVGDGGWWAREYTFDFVVAVDITSDRPPVISNVTTLTTTVSQDARTVEATITDDNPSGGAAGIGFAELIYTVNSGVEQVVAMTEGDPDVYSGDIPGMSPGDTVSYYIKATDVENLSTTSNPQSYQIYLPSDADVLVVVNGFSSVARVLQLMPYYFELIGVIQVDYDLWYYGPVSAELLSYYTSVIEIQMSEGSPSDDNRDAYSAWVAEGNKNFLLAGQEELGFLYAYEDQDFVEGDFEYDVLGVAHSYNDISVVDEGDELLGSLFLPQAGTLLGDSLAMVMSTLSPDSLIYWPVWILGDLNAANWLDQFDPRTDITTEVFMQGVAKDGTEKPVGQNWVTPSQSKVVFMAYDPLVLNSAVTAGDYWIATETVASFHQAIRWFGLHNVTSVEDNGQLPRDFSLNQNYPNPFNPSTSIKYTLPQNVKVSLKVYDILGKEVATLIDENQNSGVHEFNFNASNLASGMYIYTLRAGDFVSSKKMMLLK